MSVAEVIAGDRKWWVEKSDCVDFLNSLPEGSANLGGIAPMPSPLERRCKTCACWEYVADHLGECRALSPPSQVSFVASATSPLGPQSRRGVWPLTLETDWCGCWKPSAVQQKGE